MGKNKAEMVREGVVKGQAWTLARVPRVALPSASTALFLGPRENARLPCTARLHLMDRCAYLQRLELNRNVAAGSKSGQE